MNQPPAIARLPIAKAVKLAVGGPLPTGRLMAIAPGDIFLGTQGYREETRSVSGSIPAGGLVPGNYYWVLAASGVVGELVGDDVLHVRAQPSSKLTDPSSYTLIGKPVARVDIPAKVTGGIAYVHDLRLTDMVHARVVRPPGYGAHLLDVDVSKVEGLPGVLKVVRDGSFLGVIAEREYQAVTAMRALAQAARWSDTSALPDPASGAPTMV